MASWAKRPGTRGYGRRRRDGQRVIAFVLLLVLLGFYAYQQWTTWPTSPLIGRARVLDGDSLEISGTQLRLEGIDAPESDQTCVDAKGQTWSCGKASAQELRHHVAGRELTCTVSGRDKYQRMLAFCSAPDGSDVNAWIVRQGWALAFGDGWKYRSEQREAEAAERGIWAGTFLPPSEWRRRHP